MIFGFCQVWDECPDDFINSSRTYGRFERVSCDHVLGVREFAVSLNAAHAFFGITMGIRLKEILVNEGRAHRKGPRYKLTREFHGLVVLFVRFGYSSYKPIFYRCAIFKPQYSYIYFLRIRKLWKVTKYGYNN